MLSPRMRMIMCSITDRTDRNKSLKQVVTTTDKPHQVMNVMGPFKLP